MVKILINQVIDQVARKPMCMQQHVDKPFWLLREYNFLANSLIQIRDY